MSPPPPGFDSASSASFPGCCTLQQIRATARWPADTPPPHSPSVLLIDRHRQGTEGLRDTEAEGAAPFAARRSPPAAGRGATELRQGESEPPRSLARDERLVRAAWRPSRA